MLLQYHFTGYSFILFLSAGFALWLIPILWQRRAAPGAQYVALMEAAVSIWAFTAAFEAAATTIPLKIIWAKFSYIGLTPTPLFYYLFAQDYSQQRSVLSARTIKLLAVVPILSTLLAFTNEWHHWIWTEITLNETYNLGVYGHGFWWWLMIAYTYILIAIGALSLILAIMRFPAFYQSQIAAILLASILPLLGNIIYVSDILPIPGLDLTPVALTLNGAIIAWGVFRRQIFGLTPIARARMVEDMQDSLIVLDAHNRIVDINPSARRLLTRSGENAIGQPASDVILIWKEIVPFLTGGHTTAEIHTQDELSCFLDVQVTPIYGRNQLLFGRLIVLRDVTLPKNAEKALRELNTSLEQEVLARTADIRAEKEKGDTVLQSVDDGIAMVNVDMEVLFVNEAFTRLTGYQGTEMSRQWLWDIIQNVAPDPNWQAVQGALEQGKAWKGEIEIKHKDGRFYEAALTIHPIYDASGKLTGFVTSHRDISPQKELEAVRTQFMNSVAHEFRTPITNLKLYATLLQKHITEETAVHYMHILDNQIKRLEHLVHDSLEMLSLDSEHEILDWKPLVFADILPQVISGLLGRAKKAGVSVQIKSIPDSLPLVYGDTLRIQQALVEIGENGILYTPSGGTVEFTVGTAVTSDQTWATVTVSDDGPGISSDELAHIYNRFYRGKAAQEGSIPGTGLGLSIVQAIIHAHHGQIAINSTVGEGTAVTLSFPVVNQTFLLPHELPQPKGDDEKQRNEG